MQKQTLIINRSVRNTLDEHWLVAFVRHQTMGVDRKDEKVPWRRLRAVSFDTRLASRPNAETLRFGIEGLDLQSSSSQSLLWLGLWD